jgi:hypothetical protein
MAEVLRIGYGDSDGTFGFTSYQKTSQIIEAAHLGDLVDGYKADVDGEDSASCHGLPGGNEAILIHLSV